jgi:hypothetical protein
MRRARGLSKHRRAVDAFAIDFGWRLNDDESLTGNPTVGVARRNGAAWGDVTAEFHVSSESLLQTSVQFALGEAAEGEQDAGDYHLLVEVDTDQDRHLVSTHLLEVRETADPGAP